jgi:hypothetical protein
VINLRDPVCGRASIRTGARSLALLILLHSQMNIVTTTLNETQLDSACEFLIRQAVFVTFIFTLFGTVFCGVVFASAHELVASYKRTISRTGNNTTDKLDSSIIRYYAIDPYTQRLCEIAGWNELLCKEGCRVNLVTCLTLVAKQTCVEEPKLKQCLFDLNNIRTLRQLKAWISTYQDDESIIASLNNFVGLAYWCSSNEKPDLQQYWRQGKAFTATTSKLC